MVLAWSLLRCIVQQLGVQHAADEMPRTTVTARDDGGRRGTESAPAGPLIMSPPPFKVTLVQPEEQSLPPINLPGIQVCASTGLRFTSV